MSPELCVRMAKSGAKKQLQQNQKRLKLLRLIIAISNVAILLGRLIAYRQSNTWKLYAIALAMTLSQVFCYSAVSRMAEPLLGNDGEILDGGADITVASIASYYQDIIYVCALVQVVCILTDKAFLAFWLLPLVLGFIVYTTLVKPLMQQFQAPKATPESATERKQREKAEKKAAKPKFKTVRN